MFRWIIVDILVILMWIEIMQMWLFGKGLSSYLVILSFFAFVVVLWYILEKLGALPQLGS
jgi:hypothetical protein